MAELFQRDQRLVPDLFELTLLQLLKLINGNPTQRFVRSCLRKRLKAVGDSGPRRKTGALPKIGKRFECIFISIPFTQ